jgi:hypothetical protein
VMGVLLCKSMPVFYCRLCLIPLMWSYWGILLSKTNTKFLMYICRVILLV